MGCHSGSPTAWPTGFLHKALSLYVSHADTQLRKLEKAIADGNIQAVTLIAHTMKSSTAQLGAQRLAGMYAELEAASHAGKAGDFQELYERLTPEPRTVCALMQEELNRTGRSAA